MTHKYSDNCMCEECSKAWAREVAKAMFPQPKPRRNKTKQGTLRGPIFLLPEHRLL